MGNTNAYLNVRVSDRTKSYFWENKKIKIEDGSSSFNFWKAYKIDELKVTTLQNCKVNRGYKSVFLPLR